ncbi:MAG TPA: hypothetical protein PK229_12110 [Rhodocyclaceae bacterium]|nr:hypothetical protein [Rhodocyclaceae bacterium]
MSSPTHAAPRIGEAYSGITPAPPKYAAIQVSTSGDNTIVNAVTGKKLLVLAYNYMANGSVNVKWRSNTTDQTGLAYLAQNTGKVAPFSQVGWFKTSAGEALVLNLSGNVAVGGEVVYAEVDN